MKNRLDDFPEIDKVATGLQIKRLMEERNLSARDIKGYLYLTSEQAVYAWISGRNTITTANLYALSKLFRVPMDQIIRGNMDAVDEQPSKEKATDIVIGNVLIEGKEEKPEGDKVRRFMTYYQKFMDTQFRAS